MNNNANFPTLVKKIYKSNIYNKNDMIFVKWGNKECIEYGIYKEKDRNSILKEGTQQCIIVAYNLSEGNASVAYSEGYKKDGKIAYTLEDMLNLE